MASLPEHTPQFYLGEMRDRFTNLHRLGNIKFPEDGDRIAKEMARSLEVGKNLLHYLVMRDTGFNIILDVDKDVSTNEDVSVFEMHAAGRLDASPLRPASAISSLILERSTTPLSNPVNNTGEFYYGDASLVVAMSSLARVIGDGRCSVELVEKSEVFADELLVR